MRRFVLDVFRLLGEKGKANEPLTYISNILQFWPFPSALFLPLLLREPTTGASPTCLMCDALMVDLSGYSTQSGRLLTTFSIPTQYLTPYSIL